MDARPTDESIYRLVVGGVATAVVPIRQEGPNIAVDLEVAATGGAPFRANVLGVVLTRLVGARNENQERAWTAVYSLVAGEEMADLRAQVRHGVGFRRIFTGNVPGSVVQHQWCVGVFGGSHGRDQIEG